MLDKNKSNERGYFFEDFFYYALEGEKFEYVDGKVNKINNEWTMVGYPFEVAPVEDE